MRSPFAAPLFRASEKGPRPPGWRAARVPEKGPGACPDDATSRWFLEPTRIVSYVFMASSCGIIQRLCLWLPSTDDSMSQRCAYVCQSYQQTMRRLGAAKPKPKALRGAARRARGPCRTSWPGHIHHTPSPPIKSLDFRGLTQADS